MLYTIIREAGSRTPKPKVRQEIGHALALAQAAPPAPPESVAEGVDAGHHLRAGS
jgi:hypothetical protein